LGLFLAVLAAPIAAAMAFLITYGEYQHHGFDRARLIGHCLRVAAVAFAVFAALSLVVAWLLARMLSAG
jgi:hypothetical protein